MHNTFMENDDEESKYSNEEHSFNQSINSTLCRDWLLLDNQNICIQFVNPKYLKNISTVEKMMTVY